MINIRQAKKVDCRAIQLLNNELFELELQNSDKFLVKNWPMSQEGESYFLRAIENDCVFVAEMGGEIVGYILGAIADFPYYDFKIAELCNMCIKCEYKRKGIGSKLMDAFKDHYKKIGVTNFIVTASYLNKNAIEFYKSQGFEIQNVTLSNFNK